MHEDQRPDELRVLAPMSRRQAILAGAAGAATLLLPGCGGSSDDGGGADGAKTTGGSKLPATAPVEAGPLLIANWVDYSDPTSYKEYTRRVKPKITVDGYGSNDELLAKLSAGGANFDIVVPTGYAVKTMIDKGLAMELSRDLIPNMKNIQERFRNVAYDPGNKYSVPKDYGVTSFWWRTAVVKEDPKTLGECFELLEKYRSARVNFLEGATQNAQLALNALGFSLNSEDPDEIEQAKQLLIESKPYIDTINSTFIPRGEKGSIDFGTGWNGDVARIIAARAKKDDEVKFLLPEGKTEFWVDNWVIPASAKNPVAAHKWIDLMLDPEIAAKETAYHAYAVPVIGVEKLAPKELVENPIIYVPQERLAEYETQVQTPRGQQLRDRMYTEFKAA